MQVQYLEQPIEEYSGNPLIEALPPIMESADVARGITHLPKYSESQRDLPAEIRLHLLERLRYVVVPDSRHVRIAKSLLRFVRSGYVSRNPLDPRTRQHIHFLALRGADGIPEPPGFVPTSSAACLTGLSGVGKSTLVQSTLQLLPQVLMHEKYSGKRLPLVQVVWLKFDCPHDGSFTGLCFAFFLALDQALGIDRYYAKYSRGKKSVSGLLTAMVLLACEYHVGILVIDELQNLFNAGHVGADKMLAFFVELVNSVGIPTVLVGTYKAIELFSKSLRMARRATQIGVHTLTPAPANSKEWELLAETIWHYQWTKRPTAPTAALFGQLHQITQGIPDVYVKLYLLAQEEAIESEVDVIDYSLVCRVMNERLSILKPALTALRAGTPDALLRFDDLWPNHEMMEKLWERSRHGAMNTLIRLEEDDLIPTVLNQDLGCATVATTEQVEKEHPPESWADISNSGRRRRDLSAKKSIDQPLEPADLRNALKANDRYQFLRDQGDVMPAELIQYLQGG